MTLFVVAMAASPSCGQMAGMGTEFWPYVEPPPGMDMEIDVPGKKIIMHAKQAKEPYIITVRDDKTGQLEKYRAWVDELVWEDARQFATAKGNIKIENERYTVLTDFATYARASGEVVSPGTTVVIERLPDGRTNFIKAGSATIYLNDKGVNRIKVNKLIESRVYTDLQGGAASSNWLHGDAPKPAAPPPPPQVTPTPVAAAAMDFGAPRRFSGEDF